MNDFQLQVVYNVPSFALASMMDTTEFLIFRSFVVQAKYQSAVIVSGVWHSCGVGSGTLLESDLAHHWSRIWHTSYLCVVL